MRRVSLNERLAQEAGSTAEIRVALFEITHPELEKPIRLSTDNTERLSSDPLYYGTRSTWRGASPAVDPYLWVIASTLLPSDKDDMPAGGNVALENLDAGLVRAVRSYRDMASISMAVVLASSPNLLEAEYTGMEILSADIDAGEIVLTFGREEIEMEPFPADRMTRNNNPGLFL